MIRALKSIYLSVADRLRKPFPPPTPKEISMISAFRESLSVASVSTEHNVWNGYAAALADIAVKEDPREFTRWPVLHDTMMIGPARYVIPELWALRTGGQWKRWRTAIAETPMGAPAPYPLYPFSSGNAIHHGYHLAEFERSTGLRLGQFDFIFEFGGGYGSMCRIAHNAGFSGKYLIFDLPHFSALQRFYLESLGIDDVTCTSDIDALPDKTTQGARAMFIATWSISEAPISLRERILPLVKNFDAVLISFQKRFEEIDNVEFFNKWQRDAEFYFRVSRWKIPQLPHSEYLFGRRLTCDARS